MATRRINIYGQARFTSKFLYDSVRNLKKIYLGHILVEAKIDLIMFQSVASFYFYANYELTECAYIAKLVWLHSKVVSFIPTRPLCCVLALTIVHSIWLALNSWISWCIGKYQCFWVPGAPLSHFTDRGIQGTFLGLKFRSKGIFLGLWMMHGRDFLG